MFALVCASLALAACADRRSDDTPFAPQFAGQGVSRMPFGGSCHTEVTMTGETTMFFTGVCQLRGIGRVTVLAYQTLTFTQAGIVMANTSTYTTPAGDEIYGTFEGVGFPDPDAPQTAVVFSGHETYRGGTGRFADIAGSAHATGGASLATLTGHYTTHGTITF
jgi:hypothetical protein